MRDAKDWKRNIANARLILSRRVLSPVGRVVFDCSLSLVIGSEGR